MPFHDRRLIASALFAGMIAMPGVALAQTGEAETPPAAQEQTEQPSQQPAPGQAEAVTPTDEQLQSFAAATIDIVQIQEAVQAQMQAAVEKAGLTIEEYNAIARAAQTDPAVDQALKKLIQKSIGG